MKLSDQQLKMILVGTNLITYEQLDEIIKDAEDKKTPLIDYLPTTGFVSPEQLGKLIAGSLKYNYVNLRKQKIDEEALNLVPEIMARDKGVVSFAKTKTTVKLGMLDPENWEIIHLIEKRAGKKVLPYFITRTDLESALTKYRGSIQTKFAEILDQLKDESLTTEERDNITIKVVDTLMQYGYETNASDIHIEPYKNYVLVRFRIDGVMHDILKVTKDLQEFIMARIKILSKMRTDEHRAAQDGRFRFDIFTREEQVDVRVSVIPMIHGEKVVMRLLTSRSRQFSLKDLGLSDTNLQKVQRCIKYPHGMILITGPTGSGKTTTAYEIIKILNKREVNISSIEDPIEYDIEGINQIQVNQKTNLTFAKGLRAILRQDPDVILIGEIRDEETASIAVNASLTGHLVLSTLHTNDAATTLPRLLDMGIEPFLVASTVNVSVAQRLVRQICPMCRASHKINSNELKILDCEPYIKDIILSEGQIDINRVRFYEGLGCEVCNSTGFIGRIGIYEVLEISETIRALVVKSTSSDVIFQAAKKEGMTTMLQDGVRKALMGITTLAEVMRVTKDN